jgi:hypothetical protein
MATHAICTIATFRNFGAARVRGLHAYVQLQPKRPASLFATSAGSDLHNT